jgi:hypothetical protein
MLHGALDAINLITTSEETSSADAGDVLDVRGWIVPPHAPANIVIGGRRRYAMTVGDPRPDVVSVLGDPGAQLSGFRAVVPTSDLESGRHEIALVAWDERGSERVLASRTIDVRVHHPVGEGKPVAAAVDYYVDEAGASHLIEGDRLAVPRTELVTIRGWAADDNTRTGARGAVAFIGDHALPVVYGFERLDVAAALGSEALRYSGFSANFPGSYVGPGETRFTISLLTGDGRGFVPTRLSLLLTAR